MIISKILGKLILSILNWKVVGTLPDLKKYVLIVAPHTSNWDFFIGLFVKWAMGFRGNWIAKHTIFVGPVGWLLKKFGGIPIKRDTKSKMVDLIVEQYQQNDEFRFALAPEGTRKKTNRWKTGFYAIAKGAGVPILPVAFDYKHKTFVIGKPYYLTENQKKDCENIYKWYLQFSPKRPENLGEINFDEKIE